MNTADFELLSQILKERSGLVLSSDKAYLIESRLTPVARKHRWNGLDDLIAEVRKGSDEELLREITEAMTTNESLFFRDQRPFDSLRDVVLPSLLEKRANGQKKIRILSAACSSGQEPYSLAILLKEQAAKLNGWSFEIVATDISDEMLEKARLGIYSQFEVQRGLPIALLVKYFRKDDDKWQLDSGLRSMVTFKNFNLLEDPQILGRFDIVFCRNVLIYFDQDTKSRVLEGLAGILPEDGVLFLGGAETVIGVTDRFEPVPNQRGIYRPKN